jgi:hypothetical protein
MKDRSNLALSLAVIALVVALAGLLACGLYIRSRVGRTNHVVRANMVRIHQQGLTLRLAQLETAALNVRFLRAMGRSPREEDIQTLVNEIEGLKIEAPEDSPILTQLNQWKRQMLEQLQVPVPTVGTEEEETETAPVEETDTPTAP